MYIWKVLSLECSVATVHNKHFTTHECSKLISAHRAFSLHRKWDVHFNVVIISNVIFGICSFHFTIAVVVTRISIS